MYSRTPFAFMRKFVLLSFLPFVLIWPHMTYGNEPSKQLVPVFSIPVYRLPVEMNLCSEPVPLTRMDIFEMLDREFTVSVYDQAQIIMWLKRATRYFPYIESKLKEQGLPEDLKYVAVVESSLKTYTYSPAGAVGPWQFMKPTAERYGLLVTDWIDERLNFERATEVSINYLQDLHRLFGNWTLAVAAYNCGEKRVAREIEDQGVRSFYDLNLPLETERYIFRVLAAKLILAAPEQYGYILPYEFRYCPMDSDTIEFSLAEETNLKDIAGLCGATIKMIREMNPEIKRNSLPPGKNRLKIPKGTADQFKTNLLEYVPKKTLKVSSHYGKKKIHVR